MKGAATNDAGKKERVAIAVEPGATAQLDNRLTMVAAQEATAQVAAERPVIDESDPLCTQHAPA